MGKLIPRGKEGSGDHFEIEYSVPFAGLDSNGAPPYIRPNALTFVSNFLLSDNQYIAESWQLQGTSGTLGNQRFLGAFDLNGSVFVCTQSDVSGPVLNVWVANVPSGSAPTFFLSDSIALSSNQQLGFISYININGVTYFSFPSCDSIFQFDGNTLALLTNFLGGEHLAELNGRLIVGNVWQTVSSVLTNFPYQFAWSAPGGAYAQFNPLVGGLVTGAGFNNLPDVEDTITGMFTTGPTGYVVRQHGITEVTPLNSGIQPFDFNHLWASHKGIGTVFPQTVAQYGSLGCFISEDDIYTIGYDGINVISGSAKSSIYAAINSLQQTESVQSVFSVVLIDNNPTLCYVLVTQKETSSNNFTYTFFIYAMSLKEWMVMEFTSLRKNNSGVPIGYYLSAHNLLFGNTAQAYSDIIFWDNIFVGNNTSFLFLDVYQLTNQSFLSTDTDKLAILQFPMEEVIFGRDVTVDGILIYLNVTNPITVTVDVSGTMFSTFTAVARTTLYKVWPVRLPYTGVFPQLTLTFTATLESPIITGLKIGKVSMFCTVDQTQRVI